MKNLKISIFVILYIALSSCAFSSKLRKEIRGDWNEEMGERIEISKTVWYSEKKGKFSYEFISDSIFIISNEDLEDKKTQRAEIKILWITDKTMQLRDLTSKSSFYLRRTGFGTPSLLRDPKKYGGEGNKEDGWYRYGW